MQFGQKYSFSFSNFSWRLKWIKESFNVGTFVSELSLIEFITIISFNGLMNSSLVMYKISLYLFLIKFMMSFNFWVSLNEAWFSVLLFERNNLLLFSLCADIKSHLNGKLFKYISISFLIFSSNFNEFL